MHASARAGRGAPRQPGPHLPTRIAPRHVAKVPHGHNGSVQNLRMRVMRDTDVAAVTALNNATHPAVTLLTEEQTASLYAMCDVKLVATNRDGEIIAFLLSMGQGQRYDSENYRWFEDRGVRHQYIDRVVVGESA